MSVINTMLQELDRRNGRAGGEALTGDAIRSTKPSSAWPVSRGMLLVLLGVVTVSASGAVWLQHRGAAPSTAMGAPAAPVFIANTPLPAQMQAASAAAATPMAATEPTGTARAIAPELSTRSSSAGSTPVAMASPEAPKASHVVAVVQPAASASAGTAAKPDKIEDATPPAHAAVASPKAPSAKTYSPTQVSANLVAEAVRLDRQGHLEDAKALLERALGTNPIDAQARRMLVRLQIDTGRIEAAAVLLVEARRLHPEQPDFTLTLARLKAETGDMAGAIQLLEEGQAAARDEPQYHALLAALLVRARRLDEAVQHYLVALRSDPANPRWLVGVGVALEGTGNQTDAAEAYRRAEGTSRLTAEMATFVSERLAQLRTLDRSAASGLIRSALAPGQ